MKTKIEHRHENPATKLLEVFCRRGRCLAPAGVILQLLINKILEHIIAQDALQVSRDIATRQRCRTLIGHEKRTDPSRAVRRTRVAS